MNQFWGLIRYEYRMTIQRWGMWVAFGVLYVLYGVSLFAVGSEPFRLGSGPLIERSGLWQAAGQIVFRLNLFMPVVGGIVGADRLWRDYRLGVRELQSATPLGDWTYLVGKYLGVLAGILTPVFVFVVAIGVISLAGYQAPVEFMPMLLAATLVLTVPAFAFITIFSLACPLVMPVRVYQVLFTGYWFWGNFLSPKVIPTLSDTLLTTGGMWAFQGFFGGFINVPATQQHSGTDAVLNLAVLAICIIAAFIALERFMAWQARRV